MHCKACNREYKERPKWLGGDPEGLCDVCESAAMDDEKLWQPLPRGDQRAAKEGLTEPL